MPKKAVRKKVAKKKTSASPRKKASVKKKTSASPRKKASAKNKVAALPKAEKAVVRSKPSAKVKAILESSGIQKQFGKLIGTLAKAGGSGGSDSQKGWSWGLPSLNYICTGNPMVGLPQGRIIEIYGPESSGKTTLCIQAAVDCQRRGGVVAFVDAEHSLDLRYAIALGLNPADLIFVQPDYGEQAQAMVNQLIEESVDLVIVDSVAALTPLAVIEGNFDKQQIGLQARLMSQSLSKISKTVSKSKSTLIFTNQTRMKIGVLFGNPETTSGGNALKFYATIRLRAMISIAAKRAIKGAHGTLTGKKEKERLGAQGDIKCVKNKVFRPFLTTTIPLFYGTGFDGVLDLYDFAVRVGVLTKRGKVFTLSDGKKITVDEMEDQAAAVLTYVKDIDFDAVEVSAADVDDDDEGDE